jgi:hypothetical protein
VEVEVDDETGEVTVTDMKSADEVGRALNPRLVEQQLRGGAWMGMSHAARKRPSPITRRAIMGRLISTLTLCLAPAIWRRITSVCWNALPKMVLMVAKRAR